MTSTPTKPVDNVVIAMKGIQDRTTNITAGTTVENKGKLILTIFEIDLPLTFQQKYFCLDWDLNSRSLAFQASGLNITSIQKRLPKGVKISPLFCCDILTYLLSSFPCHLCPKSKLLTISKVILINSNDNEEIYYQIQYLKYIYY